MNSTKTTLQVLLIAATLIVPAATHAQHAPLRLIQALQELAAKMPRVDKNKIRLLQQNTIDFNKSKFFQRLQK